MLSSPYHHIINTLSAQACCYYVIKTYRHLFVLLLKIKKWQYIIRIPKIRKIYTQLLSFFSISVFFIYNSYIITLYVMPFSESATFTVIVLYMTFFWHTYIFFNWISLYIINISLSSSAIWTMHLNKFGGNF